MASSKDPTKRLPAKTRQARVLRQTETEAEFRLWGDLRNRLLNGYKFTRQVPIGPFIADFLCRDRRLVVEIDGSQHALNERDTSRTRWLNLNGYSIIRFWNHEVLKERRAVLETILAALEGQLVGKCDATRFSPAYVLHAAPSSGPSGHLLPDGEKREQVASRFLTSSVEEKMPTQISDPQD